MSLIGNFAAKLGLRERRKGARVPTRGLEAFYSVSGNRRPVAIKDIGSAGICLTMEKPDPPGTHVQLTLRRKVLEEAECGTQVSLSARVVRAEKQEVGLEFVNEHIDAAAWSALVLKAAQLSARNDGVRVFRIARALAFLERISPSGAADFLKAITGGMSYDGEERALEIVLLAEEMLVSAGQVPKSAVSPNLIRRIVERGVNLDSWEADVAQYWAGLLASSSLKGSDDRESIVYAELLSKLDRTPVRILATGCEMATEIGWDAGFVFSRNIQCSMDAMKKILGVRDTVAIDRGLSRLQEFGMLQESLKAPTFDPIMQIDITPTELGLKLYARCKGRLELPEPRAAGSGNPIDRRSQNAGVC